MQTGERVLGSGLAYWLGEPGRGDVIIFRYPRDPSIRYVKRVIGLPGDRIQIRDGRVYLNGSIKPEPYKLYKSHENFGVEYVKAGSLFVMGDNRDMSNDSRTWGELPLRNVEAKALLCYWPISRASWLK